jgi:hypothetical protein
MCTTASRSPGLRVWFLVPDMCICVFDPLRGHVTWRAAASARARSAAAGGGTVACAAQGPSAIPSIPWWLGFCRGRRRLPRQRSGSLARGGAGALCPRECESTQPVAPEMIIYTPPRSCQWHPMLRCRQGSSFYVPHLHTALPSLLCPGQCPKRLRDEELVPCAQGLLISTVIIKQRHGNLVVRRQLEAGPAGAHGLLPAQLKADRRPFLFFGIFP